ncbi:MAG: hypothetical protein E6614_01260 [Bradyrhizobium sp.]|jgi:hypothetical protein|uniref:hypothetical protein n=1 Tax=Bradyrhizobium TaxID=374 RepID=UPI001FEEA2A8|nr:MULTISPECIES: hypothetical protein [unclassified Bradyrhizobium]MDU0960329.1 hypothetical protein [Bradyrhizobium sp.]MDU1493718.1 hypothetical protein [Bradyrhizobium sp.]MDU1543989.1 hypothetical protein [Bradyrhizobium sp.]MDU1691751.1 hypothetical protein [Bradyrhizobium sp.]MDU1808483.1 hypothetical protein [Bradyrhizobium sp.]
MKTPSSRSSYKCQTKDGSHSGRCDGADPDNVSRRSTSDLANIRFKATDDDLGLIVLGKQLEEAVAKIRALYDPSSPDHLERIEAMLGDLAPIEQAIMATPARTLAGLGVKARHAAYVNSEHWDAPIDEIDWDARAVRSLIEAVCDVAAIPFSSGSNSKEQK